MHSIEKINFKAQQWIRTIERVAEAFKCCFTHKLWLNIFLLVASNLLKYKTFTLGFECLFSFSLSFVIYFILRIRCDIKSSAIEEFLKSFAIPKICNMFKFYKIEGKT